MMIARRERVVVSAILIAAAILGARGITDESADLWLGDIVRYVMNGVFLHDLTIAGGAWNLEDLLSFGERYYARYPALSLGHHPPLPSAALVPFFAVFGVSLFAARLSALAFFLLATWCLFALGRRIYGWQTGAWAAALFATNTFVLTLGQRVLSEMPMLALVLASFNLLLLYCETQRATHFVWFVIAAAASLYAKQLAVFLFPIYGIVLVSRLGWASLVRPHVLALTVLGALLVLPLAAITLMLSPSNLEFAAGNVSQLTGGLRPVSVLTTLTEIFAVHLSPPTAVALLAGIIMAVVRRDAAAVWLLGWILLALGGTVVLAGNTEPARYAFGAMPAYCLLTASLVRNIPPRRAAALVATALPVVLLWQTWLIRDEVPVGGRSHDVAAQYVIAHGTGPTVLYDSSIDAGYFVFFMRKHDAAKRFVVLQADRLLTRPPTKGEIFESRVTRAEEIHRLLQQFGVQFVVVEERTSEVESLRLLQAELRTRRFTERQRLPIVNGRSRIPLDLVIYEYLDAQPADPDAELDLRLARGRRNIALRLKDLVPIDQR